MLIFWRQRLVLLATPKTGTTSLEASLESMADVAVLRPPALKHTTASSYRRHLAPYLEERAGGAFRTVAMMREPGDWLGSWYRSRLREADEIDHLDERDLPAPLRSFPEFVEAHLLAAPPPAADVGSQASFLRDGGRLGVDRLFRYEDFEAFTEFLESELGCELLLPRLNASPARDLSLPPDLAERLRQAQAEDLSLYATIG